MRGHGGTGDPRLTRVTADGHCAECGALIVPGTAMHHACAKIKECGLPCPPPFCDLPIGHSGPHLRVPHEDPPAPLVGPVFLTPDQIADISEDELRFFDLQTAPAALPQEVVAFARHAFQSGLARMLVALSREGLITVRA